MSNKKRSLDWFLNAILKNGYTKQLPVLEYQEAKEMHKEEIIKAMSIAFTDGMLVRDGEKSKYKDWYEYYEETFGGLK